MFRVIVWKGYEMDDKGTVTAVITMTIEVDSRSTWGPTCTVDQVQKQGAEGAVNEIRGLIDQRRYIRIVGKPVVKAVYIAPKEA